MYFKVPLLIFLSINYVICSKLNLPRVLLPIFQGFSTNFTLEVTGVGCYKWSSSRLDIVSITPVDENPHRGCSQKAVVSSVSRERTRNMAIVLAEEVVTGQIFRADVIVDVISRLNIVTTTRELYMEEPPEMFEVRAYDNEGNEFTTLEGVEFHWNVAGGTRSGQSVLRFMSFRESTYETPPSIAMFDSIGKQGHIVLLEGVRTGITKVSVQLQHSEYRSVPSVEVSLTVIANLIIDPSDAYIMLGDIINYRILQVRQGRLVEVNLANSHYVLVPEDNSLVQISGDKLKGLGLGRTKLTLRDSEQSEGSEQERLPCAHVTVTEPEYITLAIGPRDSWSLFVGHKAMIVTHVYDGGKHRITLGSEARVSMAIDNAIFSIGQRTANGSVAAGTAVSAGVAEVTSVLYAAGAKPSDRPSPLQKASSMLHVYTPIKLTPSIVVLPYHHLAKSEVSMTAEGGDGIYSWDTANHSVAIVSQSGTVTATGEGHTTVVVSMATYSHLSASSQVHSLKPTSIEILAGVREAEVNSHIHLQVALFAHTKMGSRVAFSDCSQIRFVVKLDSTSFLHDTTVKSVPVTKACGVVSLLAKSDSKSRVIISFPSEDGILQAETVIASFKPLTPVHPIPGKPVVLAVGSSRHAVFTGGPRPWFGKVSVANYPEVSLFRSAIVVERQEFYVFNILCTEIGSRIFDVNVATEPYTSTYSSVKSTASIEVICARPRHVELSVDTGVDCPLSGTDQVISACNSKFRINVAVKDSQGQLFDNFTSLSFKWLTGKDPILSMDDEETVELSSDVQPDFILPEKHYKDVTTRGSPGSTAVRARAVGYRTNLLHSLSIATPAMDTKPEGTLLLKIVEPVSSVPASISVINRPSSRVTISLEHGSGYFSVVTHPDHITSAEYDRNGRKIVVSPKIDGQTSITVTDLCLPSSVLTIPTQVVNIGSVRVEVVPRVEKSRRVTATVKLYDISDRPVMSDSWSDVSLEAEDPSVVIVSQTVEEGLTTGRFTVTGVTVGRTLLIAKWNNLTSQPVSIQVFGAIRLSPRNITLIVGSEYQLRVIGGPGPDLQYQVTDSSIATVSSTGLVTASHIGDTIVTVTIGSSSSGSEVVSKDSITVTVIPLGGVTISAPTSVMAVGGVQPIWAVPLPYSLSTPVLASVPSVRFQWTVASTGILTLKDRLATANVIVKNEDRLSMVVKATRPGRTSIHLTVTISGGTGTQIAVRALMEIEVVDELMFVRPNHIDHLLIAPSTRVQLATNQDNIKYNIMSESSSSRSSSSAGSQALSSLTSVISLEGDILNAHYPGHAAIIATSSSLATSAILPIEVKPVHYMMLNVVNQLNSSTPLAALPVGLELLVNVSYHDSFGKVFYACPSSLQVDINRNDRVTVNHGPSNSSVSLSLDSIGSSVVHIHDAISLLSHDYIKFPVDDHVVPHRTWMAVGEVVCFSSAVGSNLGTWHSNSGTIIMDPSGAAKAVKPGQATLTYVLNNPSLSSSISIQVFPLYQVAFSRNAAPLSVSNSEHSQLSVPIEMLTERGRLGTVSPCPDNAPSPLEFPFRCEMRYNSLTVSHSVYNVFSVMPHFDKAIGSYSCLLKVISGPSVNTSTIQSNLTLRVVPVMGGAERADSVVVAFHPAIIVTSTPIKLNSPSSKSYVTVVATPLVASQVSIESSDSTVLVVGTKEQRSAVTISWSVSIEREFANVYEKHKDLHVTIASRLTNQSLKIPVVFQGSVQSGYVYIPNEDWGFTPSAHNSILIAIIAIIVFFFTSNYCYLKWNRPSNVTSSPRGNMAGRDLAHSTLQEAAFGRKLNISPYSATRTVYGSSPGSSPLNSSSPRLRKLYPSD